MSKRVFVSVTRDRNLTSNHLAFKRALMAKISAAGLEPQEFLESGLAGNLTWSFENVDRVMRRCLGAVIVGFSRWEFGKAKFVNDYSHYEGAVAITLGLPLLTLAEHGVEQRGILNVAGGRAIASMPKGGGSPDWLESPEFTKRWEAWLGEMEERKDVFLGYCSKSKAVANAIQLLLQKHKASVLNWAMDFRAGHTILSEIEQARARCRCGIFLFSEDDPLEGVEGGAAPRDNVVFEAGYFMSAKGSERCLIIQAGKAKIPADVGGMIYLPLGTDGDVDAIEGRLAAFLETNL
jgi:Predicted nucleotide-binding protein containing TIR-like domain